MYRTLVCPVNFCALVFVMWILCGRTRSMLITWGGRGHGEEEVFIWDPEIRLFSFEKKRNNKTYKKNI